MAICNKRRHCLTLIVGLLLTSCSGLNSNSVNAMGLELPGETSPSHLTETQETQAIQDETDPRPRRLRVALNGQAAFVIFPTAEVEGPTPWIIYAPTLGEGLPGEAEEWMFRQFLAAGIAIAGIDVGESYGSPQGRDGYNALYDHVTSAHGFAPRASLLARSRGGLMVYSWAAEHPERVCCITGIYPVCNLTSYPGLDRALWRLSDDGGRIRSSTNGAQPGRSCG